MGWFFIFQEILIKKNAKIENKQVDLYWYADNLIFNKYA